FLVRHLVYNILGRYRFYHHIKFLPTLSPVINGRRILSYKNVITPTCQYNQSIVLQYQRQFFLWNRSAPFQSVHLVSASRFLLYHFLHTPQFCKEGSSRPADLLKELGSLPVDCKLQVLYMACQSRSLFPEVWPSNRNSIRHQTFLPLNSLQVYGQLRLCFLMFLLCN